MNGTLDGRFHHAVTLVIERFFIERQAQPIGFIDEHHEILGEVTGRMGIGIVEGDDDWNGSLYHRQAVLQKTTPNSSQL